MVTNMDEKQVKNVLKKRDRLLTTARTLGISVLVDEDSNLFADVGHARSFAETGIFTFIQAIYLLMFAPWSTGHKRSFF